jgi:hypothetical protein
LQEIFKSIGIEGGNDPVLMIKAISICISQLKGEVEQHRKAEEAAAKLKETQACQLDYMKAGTESLEDALKRRSTMGMVEAYRELVLGPDKFKAGLLNTAAGKK